MPGVELACDGEWGEDVHLESVEGAVHARDALAAGTCTREQVSALASRALAMQGEAMQSDAEAEAASVPVTIGAGWPVTVEQADVLFKLARLTRALMPSFAMRWVTGRRWRNRPNPPRSSDVRSSLLGER